MLVALEDDGEREEGEGTEERDVGKRDPVRGRGDEEAGG